MVFISAPNPFMSDKPWETLSSAVGTSVLVETVNGNIIFGKLRQTDAMFNMELEDCVVVDTELAEH